jgi:hypothetical protein
VLGGSPLPWSLPTRSQLFDRIRLYTVHSAQWQPLRGPELVRNVALLNGQERNCLAIGRISQHERSEIQLTSGRSKYRTESDTGTFKMDNAFVQVRWRRRLN